MLGSLVGDAVERETVLRIAADRRAAAFCRLVDHQLEDAYRLAAVILGDRVEAEDAVHDAVVSAWRGFAALRDASSFEPWFRRIVVNGSRDRLRSRRRRQVRDLGRELVESEHPAQADVSEATAARDAVTRALDGLDLDQRLVVVLRYHADMTVPAIAAATGMPDGTVKSRLHRALEQLRRAIEEAER